MKTEIGKQCGYVIELLQFEKLSSSNLLTGAAWGTDAPRHFLRERPKTFGSIIINNFEYIFWNF
jgi:hypothetical protein